MKLSKVQSSAFSKNESLPKFSPEKQDITDPPQLFRIQLNDQRQSNTINTNKLSGRANSRYLEILRDSDMSEEKSKI